jgi:RNA polymerase sigma-70 factor (ECF subfamily)
VRKITRAFLRQSADADDAAQLALLAILKSASTYRGEAAVEGWAKRIAVRATMRFIQRERRKFAFVCRKRLYL